jgi:N-acetyl-anhydromuramyl-L-alanine amidase AmpD
MKFIKHYLPETEYYKETFKKEQIYLHHTVSQTAASARNWWVQDGIHVATAYIVDKDGTIYENFDPRYWSYHLKVGKSIERKSIGIEIVNEGWLTEKYGTYYWFNGAAVYKGDVIILEEKWRDQLYFAAYTKNQVKSAAILTKFLAYNFDIPFNFVDNLKYDIDIKNNFKGILSHCNVREDKTDISPAFPMEKFKECAKYAEENKILPRGLDQVGVKDDDII